MALGAAASPLCGQSVQVESFEKVWQTINATYWDPEFGGLDWQGVHDELLPQAEAATSREELRGVLNEMISRLEQSHFGILAGDDLFGDELEGEGESETQSGETEPTEAEVAGTESPEAATSDAVAEETTRGSVRVGHAQRDW